MTISAERLARMERMANEIDRTANLAKLDGESGMYNDWMIENVSTYRTAPGFGGVDTIELEIYDEYTGAEFVSDDIVMLMNIVSMLAGENVELASYTVEGTTVRALPL